MKTVIEMAREAGIEFTYDPTETRVRAFVECWEDEMEKFADLIRADEREVWAKDADWCVQNHLEHLIPERIRARGTK